MIRILFALGILVVLVSRGHADEAYTCADVRAAVKTIARGSGVNEKRAAEILEVTARGAGATEDQIARAKKCFSNR